MKKHQSTIGKNDEWITPKDILQPLGYFDLDPCAAMSQPWTTAEHHWTNNGLSHQWHGRVWLNPPFNRYERPKWMQRMAEHGNGIMLVPGALETKAFKQWVYPYAKCLLAIDGRPHFCYVDGTKAKANSGCTIVLVAYSNFDMEILKRSGLGRVLTWVR